MRTLSLRLSVEGQDLTLAVQVEEGRLDSVGLSSDPYSTSPRPWGLVLKGEVVLHDAHAMLVRRALCSHPRASRVKGEAGLPQSPIYRCESCQQTLLLTEEAA